MKHSRNTTWRAIAICAALTLLSGAMVGHAAGVLAQITKVSDQKITGMTRWEPVSKQYAVTPTGENYELKISPRDVKDIQVKKPEHIEKAANLVTQGQYSTAIPVLQQIMKDYTMLQWDATAGKYLLMAYLKTSDPKQAAETGDKVVMSNPKAAYDKEMAPLYWEALVLTEQFSKLRKMLDKAAEMGDREMAAIAQVRRGDMARQKGDNEEALIDGYLRTAYFFQTVKSVQPEALYKAAKCFEDLGQHSHAEKMRKRLLAEFPDDPYTQKVKSGS